MNVPPQQPPPGWYPDPSGAGQRYWDGHQWTEHHQVGPSPVVATAPSAGPPPVVWTAPAAGPVTVKPAPALWWIVPPALVLLVIGCVGKWVKSDLAIVDANGLDKDGSLVLGIGVVIGILLVLWRWQGWRWQAVVATCLAALGAVIAIVDISDVSNVPDIPLAGGRLADPGWGLWLTLVASIVLTVAGLALSLQDRRVRG